MTSRKQEIKGNNNTQVAIDEFNVNVGNISSILATAINDIAEMVSETEDATQDTVPFDLEEKIEYNNVRSFRPLLDEYGQFGPQIDDIYDEYDNGRPGFKRTVLRYFKTKYLLTLQHYHSQNPNASTIDVVRTHADKILNDVFAEFRDELAGAKNLSLQMEEIDTCALAVTCHAFFQCKILEKPKK